MECPTCHDGRVCDGCGAGSCCMAECPCGKELCSYPAWGGSEAMVEAIRRFDRENGGNGQSCYETHVSACQAFKAAADAPKPAQIVDLMEALKASLASARPKGGKP
jgi:hypothetical protein